MSLSSSQNYPRPAYILSSVPKPFSKTTRNASYKTSNRLPLRFSTPNRQARLQFPAASATTLNEKVRTYKRGDETPVEKLAASLASAFEGDPFFCYIHRSHDVDILSKNKIFMLCALKQELSRPDGESTIHISEDDGTVAIWHHENHWKMPFMMQLLFLGPLFRTFGWRAFQFIDIMQHVEDAHPTVPHMHLFFMGTHAATRGKGNGSIVISKMLEHCDRNEIPAYLESTNEKNLSFYKRHGFEVVGNVPGLPDDSPPLIAMWRNPKPVCET